MSYQEYAARFHSTILAMMACSSASVTSTRRAYTKVICALRACFCGRRSALRSRGPTHGILRHELTSVLRTHPPLYYEHVPW